MKKYASHEFSGWKAHEWGDKKKESCILKVNGQANNSGSEDNNKSTSLARIRSETTIA